MELPTFQINFSSLTGVSNGKLWLLNENNSNNTNIVRINILGLRKSIIFWGPKDTAVEALAQDRPWLPSSSLMFVLHLHREAVPHVLIVFPNTTH